ncbi:hypothetical protein [Pseudomonas fluorescens]|uniref:hypothetical protein n=1 Tax=Pseudomonas fluorescens TaxID=294 RepID=UPI003D1D5E37
MRHVLKGIVMLPSLAWAFSVEETLNSTVVVGNASGNAQFVQGPIHALVSLDNCHFSLGLLRHQYLQFNGPDALFIESITAPTEKTLPYLWQAEMPAGYEWSFRKRGGLSDKWFGLICESTANFSRLAPEATVQQVEVSPQLQLIQESNDLKCPGTLTDNGWVAAPSAGRPEDYVFEVISGANWRGFIIGYADTSRHSFKRINFCLVHDDQVLIGAAENDSAPLRLSAEAFEGIKKTVSAIGFQ